MTEIEIRKLAEEYIDEAVAESADPIPSADRAVAVRRVEAASKELLAAAQERNRTRPVAA